MRRVYIASKAKYRAEWRALRAKGYDIISRWIDTPDEYIGTTIGESDLDYSDLWTAIVQDVYYCNMLIVVIRPGDVLKGALVEVGIALATDAEIWVVGAQEDIRANGTWVAHPKINVSKGPIESLLIMGRSSRG